MERFNILVAVLDGNAIAEAYTFALVINEPLSGLAVNEQTLVSRAVGLRSERRELVVGIQDNDITFLNLIAKCAIQISSGDMSVRLQPVDGSVYGTAHESGQRKIAYRLAIFKMMIRALAVCSQMAGQIQCGMEIRDRTAGVITDQTAAAGLGSRIQNFGKINNS
jgi:hypothetical protein